MRRKKIRGSEPREQVRTARRGSRNPQGRTLFSMTGSRFYLLDFLRSKSTSVHFYRSRLSVSQDICRSVVPSLSKAVQCFAKPCSVSKKANTNTFRNLRRAPRRRRVGALHRIAPAAAERRSFVCLRKQKRLHATRAFTQPVPWSLPVLCVFCLRRPAPERRRG